MYFEILILIPCANSLSAFIHTGIHARCDGECPVANHFHFLCLPVYSVVKRGCDGRHCFRFLCIVLEVSTKISSADEFAIVFGINLLRGVSIGQLFVQKTKENRQTSPKSTNNQNFNINYNDRLPWIMHGSVYHVP